MSTDPKNGENQEDNFTEAEIKEAEEFFTALEVADPNKTLTAEEAGKITEMAKRTKTTVAQKEHWRTKAQQLEEAAKATKPPVAAPKKDGEEKITKADMTEYRLDTGYSKEVVDVIAETAKALNISLEDAAKKPHIASYIKSQQSADDNADASVAPSRRGASAAAGGEKDWSKVSKADMIEKRNKVMRGGRQS